MKIEKVKNENIIDFKDLPVSEAFYSSTHFATDLYIKTYDFICYKFFDDTEDQEDNGYNAIKLSNGRPYLFSPFDKVVIPNCKIVVE